MKPRRTRLTNRQRIAVASKAAVAAAMQARDVEAEKMSNEAAFLIGPGGQVSRLIGARGETPPCPEAKFKRGDVVKVRNTKALAGFPREAVVAVAITPGFSPDHALADLVGEPRPLMAQVGSRSITYILVRENDHKPYLARERDLLSSGKQPVEIGTVSRQQTYAIFVDGKQFDVDLPELCGIQVRALAAIEREWQLILEGGDTDRIIGDEDKFPATGSPRLYTTPPTTGG